MFLLCFLDCKTVRIFANSSTCEQSNKRSGTTLITESERLLRHALPISFTHFEKKNPTVLQSTCSFLYIHVRFYHPEKRSPHCKKGRNPSLGFWIQHRGFRIPGTWFLIFSQWNLNFVFQLLAGFRIPWAGSRDSKATISDPTNKNFPYSGSHKQKFLVYRIPQAKISRIADLPNKNFPYSGSHKQKFPLLRIPQTKISRIPDPRSKNFPYFGSEAKLLYSRSQKQKFPVLWNLDYLDCCEKGSVH